MQDDVPFVAGDEVAETEGMLEPVGDQRRPLPAVDIGGFDLFRFPAHFDGEVFGRLDLFDVNMADAEPFFQPPGKKGDALHGHVAVEVEPAVVLDVAGRLDIEAILEVVAEHLEKMAAEDLFAARGGVDITRRLLARAVEAFLNGRRLGVDGLLVGGQLGDRHVGVVDDAAEGFAGLLQGLLQVVDQFLQPRFQPVAGLDLRGDILHRQDKPGHPPLLVGVFTDRRHAEAQEAFFQRQHEAGDRVLLAVGDRLLQYVEPVQNRVLLDDGKN